MRQHYVTFLSPGTFVSEASTQPIDAWDTHEAAQRARTIKERHGAVPYGFYFITRLTAPPVPDGEGGMLKVQEKEVEHSGTYFLTGRIETFDEVKGRVDPKDSILLHNMEWNEYPLIVINENSYRSTLPFGVRDIIVDEHGTILERGDTVERLAYREAKKAEHEINVKRADQEYAQRRN